MKSSRQQLLENTVICAGCDDKISSTSASFRIDHCGHIFCVRCTSRLDYYESAATASINSCPVCAHLSQNRPSQSNSQFYDMFRYPQLSNSSVSQQPQQSLSHSHSQQQSYHHHHQHQSLHPQNLQDEDEGFRFQNITEEEDVDNLPTHSPNNQSDSSNHSNANHANANNNNINSINPSRSESAHLPPADHFDIYSRHSSTQYPSSTLPLQHNHNNIIINNQNTNINNNNDDDDIHTDEIIQEIHHPPSAPFHQFGQKTLLQSFQHHQQQQQHRQHQPSHEQPYNKPKTASKSNTQSFYYDHNSDNEIVESATTAPVTAAAVVIGQSDHQNGSSLQYAQQQQQQQQVKHLHPPNQYSHQIPASNSQNNSPSSSSHRSIASPHYYPKNKGNSNRFIAQQPLQSSLKASSSPPKQHLHQLPAQANSLIPPSHPNLIPLKCKEHDDFIQLYCANDKQLLCVNCYYESSKKHEGHNIAPVKHSLELITRENALFQLEAKEKLHAISSSLRICATNRSLLADNYSAICDSVHAEFAVIFDLLANQEQRIIESLTRIFDERISEYDSILADLNYLNACIHEYRDYSPPTAPTALPPTPHQPASESDANYAISLFSIYAMIRNTLKNVDFSFNPLTKTHLFSSLCDFSRPKQAILDQIPNLGAILNQLNIRGNNISDNHKPIKQTASTSNLAKSHSQQKQLAYSTRKHQQNNTNHPNTNGNPHHSIKSDKPSTPNIATMFENSAKQTPRQIPQQSSHLNFGGTNPAEHPVLASAAISTPVQTAAGASQLNSINRQGSSPSLRASYNNNMYNNNNNNNGSSLKQLNGSSNSKHPASVTSAASASSNSNSHLSYAQTIVNRSSKFSNKKQHAEQQINTLREYEKQLTPPHDSRRVQDLVKNLHNVSYYALLEEKYNSLNPTTKHRHSKKAIHPSDSSKK